MNKIIALSLIFLSSLDLVASNNTEIRELLVRNRIYEALRVLENMEINDNNLWQFVYCYYKINNYQKLAELLEKYDVPIFFSAYKYWLLGYAYEKQGIIDKAIYAYSFWKSDTTFPYYEDCGLSYFDLLLRAERYAQAESLVKVFQRFGISSKLKRSAPFKELEVLVKTDPDTAKKILTSLFDKKPTIWVYEMLERNFSPLAPDQYLKGGSLYYNTKQFQKALVKLEQCEKMIDKGSPLWGELLYAKALIYTSIPSERKKAVGILKKILKEALYDSTKCRTLLGQVYRALGKKEKAIKELSIGASSADISAKKVALWNLGELYRQDQKWNKAAPFFAEYWKTAGRDDDLADNSVLWAGLCYYLSENYDSAIHYLGIIIDQYGRGYESFEQTALWWKAKALIKAQKHKEAYAALDSIISLGVKEYYYYKTRFFYGDYDTLLSDAISGLNDLWSLFMEKIDSGMVFDYIPESINLIRASYFSELGLIEWGEKEFQTHITRGPKDISTGQVFSLFRLAQKLGFFQTAYLLGIRASNSVKDTLLAYRLRYPLFFAAEVESTARRYGLSPFLLLALIRQESAFDIYATSRAGARGLTQIIPMSGKRIAKELNIAEFNEDILYDYKINLELGASELKRLIETCDGNILCGLARYNGGDERLKLWMNYPSDEGEELFVENIDFHETRHYTKRVISNYFSYIECWSNALK